MGFTGTLNDTSGYWSTCSTGTVRMSFSVSSRWTFTRFMSRSKAAARSETTTKSVPSGRKTSEPSHVPGGTFSPLTIASPPSTDSTDALSTRGAPARPVTISSL